MNSIAFILAGQRRLRLFALLLLSFLGLAQSGLAQTTLRAYFLGNSVTDVVNYEGLQAMAESRGNTHIYARHMIPGAPLSWLWDHPNEGFKVDPYGYPTNAFPNYTWDAISLQPFDRQLTDADGDVAMIGNYINLARNKSPNAQYYVYMAWPRAPNNSDNPDDASLTADSWNALWSRPTTNGSNGTNETKDYYEKLMIGVRQASPTNKPILIVPVGEVFKRLNDKMKAGQVPGYNRIWQVYSDGIHMSNIGSYITGCTFYSTFYKADPRGMGVPAQYGAINSGLASIIQATVWEVVSTYPYSGVSVGTTVAVTGVSVSPASLALTAGQTGNLSATVSPGNATNKSVGWTSGNTAVATVNANGTVTALAAGSATITAQTVDGNKTATATVTVTAAPAGGSGLNYQYYTGSWSMLPDFSTGTVVKSGTVANFDLSPRTQNDLFAFRFTGFINITTAGSYTFFTTSDDGSKLYIDGALVVNNDGLHGEEERSGTVTLSAGKRQIEVTFFENTGGETLQVSYQGPGLAKQLIPASVLSTTGGSTGVAVTGVAVGPATARLMIGKTTSLTATVTPANATNKNVTWSSGNTAVATVNSSGVATGIAAGNALITATTADGARTATSTLTVFANSKPTAVLNASPESGTAPLVVAFNANGSSDPDAGDFILGYDWNFGDGSAREFNVSPPHTYTAAGTYTVTLRVMDNNNLYSDAVSKTITVTSGGGTTPPPSATGVLASWDFTAKGGQAVIAASAKAADVASAATGLGSGLEVINYLNDGLTATNQTAADQAGALTGNDYFSFVLTPATGKNLSIAKVDVRPVSQNVSRTFALFSSVNGFGSGKQLSSFTTPANLGAALQSIAITGHSSLTAAVEFRVYVYGATNPYESAGVGNRSNLPGNYDLAVFGTSASNTTSPPPPPPPVAGTGRIIREFWNNIGGTSVANIPLTQAVSGTAVLTSLEGPTDAGDNYGDRIRGYIIPATTGAYTFYLAGDDNSELYLSSNDSPAGKARIAQVTGWSNAREWLKDPAQKSATINLTAGQRYYVETLHKEGGGGDNLAVGWTGPGISAITVIGGANIAPFEGGNTPPPPPVVDTQAPTAPTGLAASGVTQTGFTLSWAASTDNVGVTGYEVFRGATAVGNTNGATRTLAVSGLTAATAYSMTVKARDAAGNVSPASSALAVTTQSATPPPPTGTPKLPIGMNISSISYYGAGIFYTDAMTASSEMFTFTEGGPWDTDKIDRVARDANGWPTQVPFTVDGQAQQIRFLINNFYTGRYVVLHDGVGQFVVNGLPTTVINGKTYIDFNGQGGNIWIDLKQSQAGNPVRNMRIVPAQYADGSTYPTFLPKFLDGLRPFHALRFMDWTATNDSPQKNWADRPTVAYYSQATSKGQALEYATDLCNLLDQDAWICVPHLASDDYIRQLARLLRDRLKPSLKVYIEYSNEVWNWQFKQATWIINNAPGSVDSYVPADLARINPAPSDHPEKDAYMMARVFRLFKGEFTGANAARLVKVAAVQHGWYDNTLRVLEYLKNVNQQCDIVSPAGYFNYEEEDHNIFNSRCAAVTADDVLSAVFRTYDETSGIWTQKNGEYAKRYGVGYAVYEGGQHMQPYMQGDWCYNEAVWASQIHPRMYDLYMKNFSKHVEPTVDCKLFMAFSYVSGRKSKYGSWGHLESFDQIGGNYRVIAPKYQALLDVNTPKGSARLAAEKAVASEMQVQVFPNPVSEEITVSGLAVPSLVEIVTADGRVLKRHHRVPNQSLIPVADLNTGLFIIRVSNDSQGVKSFKVIKQ